MRKAPPIVLQSEDVLLMIRIILKLQKEGDREFVAKLPNGQNRYFYNLVSHKKEIESDPESLKTFRGFYRQLVTR